MEEFVGEMWHKLITKKTETNYQESKVTLDEQGARLAVYYRALGGNAAHDIKGCDKRVVTTRRMWLQKIAGNGRKFHLTWKNQHGLYLPPFIAQFADKKLNENLYYWLAAMAAQETVCDNIIENNRQLTLQLIKSHPGLKRQYFELVDALITQRPHFPEQTDDYLQEQAIQACLKEPEHGTPIPSTRFQHHPVPLWIYPAEAYLLSVDDETEEELTGHSDIIDNKKTIKKQAQRIDNERETDGLIIFQLESLFSWSEQVNLDRCEDDTENKDAESAAEDLDIISLAKKRKAGSAGIKFDLDLPAPENDDLPLGAGMKLPEWNYKTKSFKKDFCLVQPMLSDEALPCSLPLHLQADANKLSQLFSHFSCNPTRVNKQQDGNEIDMDSWMEGLASNFKDTSEQDFFIHDKKSLRDISCLLLTDISLSTEAHVSESKRVIDCIRDSIFVFAEALQYSQDPFAIYGFSSIKNKQVRYQLIKNFSEPYRDQTRGRIQAIKPGFYTRMGAAIRQSTLLLEKQPTKQKLLLIVSDGKPNDLDQYEGRYGIEDTRQAILEAKQKGLTPFCITIDTNANDYLPYLFGSQSFCIIKRPQDLCTELPKIYLNLTSSLS